jgi:hypothetical protein
MRKRDREWADTPPADIYNVGATTHPVASRRASILAFGWQDRHRPGIGGFIGFTTGQRPPREFMRRCGIGRSLSLAPDLDREALGGFVRGTGSVRYLDAMLREREWWIYYEMTRADGAHELRLVRRPV